MSQNPYEAPQTITAGLPMAEATDGLRPELSDVCRGAKSCYQAVLIVAATIAIVFILGFLLPREIVPLVGLLMLLAVGVSAVLHFRGILLLRRVPPESGARGLLLGSTLISTAILVGVIFEVVIAVLYRAALPLEVQLGREVFSLISIVMLLIGILRIGNHYNSLVVGSKAKVSLAFYGLLYVPSIIVHGLLLWPSFQLMVANMQRQGNSLSSIGPIYFVLTILATIFYVQALDAIIKLREKPRTPPTGPVTFGGIDVPQTTTGQEMNFLLK